MRFGIGPWIALSIVCLMAPADRASAQASTFAVAGHDTVRLRDIESQMMLQLFTGVMLTPKQDSAARRIVVNAILERARLNEEAPSFRDSVVSILRRRDAKILPLLRSARDRAQYTANAERGLFVIDRKPSGRP